MKLNLLDAVGSIGVITECKSFVRDNVEFDAGCEGMLYVINTDSISCVTKERAYGTDSGKIVIDDHDIPQGTSRLEFLTPDGKRYQCGQMQRNGRFIQFSNPLDKLAIALALAYNEQGEKLARVEEELKIIKQQYGICIM